MPKDLFITQNVIDPESGEILQKKEFMSASKFDAEKGYYFSECAAGKGKHLVSSSFPPMISDNEAGKLLRLSFYVAPNSNLLVFRSGNVYKAMQKEQIAKLLGLSARSCSRFINRMLKLNVMAKKEITIIKNKSSSLSVLIRCESRCKEDNYFLNPIYFFAGKWLSSDLYFLFKSDLDIFLPPWVVSKFNAQK